VPAVDNRDGDCDVDVKPSAAWLAVFLALCAAATTAPAGPAAAAAPLPADDATPPAAPLDVIRDIAACP
jgi:hypothetical protein